MLQASYGIIQIPSCSSTKDRAVLKEPRGPFYVYNESTKKLQLVQLDVKNAFQSVRVGTLKLHQQPGNQPHNGQFAFFVDGARICSIVKDL